MAQHDVLNSNATMKIFQIFPSDRVGGKYSAFRSNEQWISRRLSGTSHGPSSRTNEDADRPPKRHPAASRRTEKGFGNGEDICRCECQCWCEKCKWEKFHIKFGKDRSSKIYELKYCYRVSGRRLCTSRLKLVMKIWSSFSTCARLIRTLRTRRVN